MQNNLTEKKNGRIKDRKAFSFFNSLETFRVESSTRFGRLYQETILAF